MDTKERFIDIPSALFGSFVRNSSRNAFFIEEKAVSYNDFSLMCGKMMHIIRQNNYQIISVYATHHLETYASILAIYLCGKTFLPVHPDNPEERSLYTIREAGAEVMLSFTAPPFDPGIPVVRTNETDHLTADFTLGEYSLETTAYILFTSGSTGIPKGVPISYLNLGHFMYGFNHIGYTLTPEDRVLQMFHLTFDLSMCSYMTGLLAGACIYPLPPADVKYTAVYEMLEEHNITYAIMVPSIISYLRPFFSEISLPHLKHNVFCGEALLADLASEWQQCVPNCTLYNVYGPTEDIICTAYALPRANVKQRNGIVCVGKPMADNIVEVFSEKVELVTDSEKGEFCLAGPYLTKGYLNKPELSATAFFEYPLNEKDVRFYHSGDIGIRDEEGDLFYLGRNDNQVKVSGGYRVELSEVEFHARKAAPGSRLVALAKMKSAGVSVIHIVAENEPGIEALLREKLSSTLPDYMQPDEYHSLPAFPLNANGKIDRRKIYTTLFGE